MDNPSFHSGSVRLGRGYSVEFTFAGGALKCEWSPGIPPKIVGRSLLPRYIKARNAFLGKVSKGLGVNIAVVDL